MKLHALKLAVLSALLGASAATLAQTYRVSGEYWGGYYAQTALTFGGQGPFSKFEWLGHTANGGQRSAFDPASLPLTMSESGTWSDSFGRGMSDVHYDFLSATDFRNNHARISLGGFSQVSTDVTSPFCPTDGAGACIGPSIDVRTQVNNTAYGSANSRWEEIYYIGGGAGTGVLTPSYQITAQLGATGGSSDGNASFNWQQKDFQGQTVLGIQASYYASSDSWWENRYDSATGLWNSSSGNGAWSINDTITGQLSFTYGAPFYVDSSLYVSVNGNGLADAGNTVTLTALALPANSRLFVASGTGYGDAVQFSGGGGGFLCATQDCATGGGGGGGGGTYIPPVPEPETYVLMLAGLGLLGWLSRRRRLP